MSVQLIPSPSKPSGQDSHSNESFPRLWQPTEVKHGSPMQGPDMLKNPNWNLIIVLFADIALLFENTSLWIVHKVCSLFNLSVPNSDSVPLSSFDSVQIVCFLLKRDKHTQKNWDFVSLTRRFSEAGPAESAVRKGSLVSVFIIKAWATRCLHVSTTITCFAAVAGLRPSYIVIASWWTYFTGKTWKILNHGVLLILNNDWKRLRFVKIRLS